MANALEERFAEVLLDKIQGDIYPSSTHMDMLESLASPQVLVEFLLHLMDRIQAEAHPSIPMMQRATRLMAEFGS